MNIQDGKLTLDLKYGIVYCGMVGCWRTNGPYETPTATVQAAEQHHNQYHATSEARRRNWTKHYERAARLEGTAPIE